MIYEHPKIFVMLREPDCSILGILGNIWVTEMKTYLQVLLPVLPAGNLKFTGNITKSIMPRAMKSVIFKVDSLIVYAQM